MRAFAVLLDRLLLTPGRSGKLVLLEDYFRSCSDPARGYALAALTGGLVLPSVKGSRVRELAATRIDAELFRLSHEFVGDLAETVSLVWPARPGANREPDLADVVETLLASGRAESAMHLEGWLDALDPTGRWALLKLVTGALRVGVSAGLARAALARFGKVEAGEIEELWHGLEPPYASLFAWLEGRAPRPDAAARARFRPVMLAHPLPDAPDPDEVRPAAFAAEWKWDGVRVQAASEGGVRRLYSRSGDDVGAAFPDVLAGLAFDGVIDGELLVRAPSGGVAGFNALQQRLNRKTPTARLMAEHPAFIRAYDLLQDGAEDVRSLPFRERRRRLERVVVSMPGDRLDLSPLIPFADLAGLDALRAGPPTPEIEGVMLKRWDAPYLAGRPAGKWYKWKRDPFVVDAVLMYAQRGHGRRSGLYSDFTFGLWAPAGKAANEPEAEGWALSPVGKAYSGFTDDEMKELDRYVRANAREKFGPVQSVHATRAQGLVLEVAFEGVQHSARHRSGLAMRFPRISRIRWDKPAAEADTLETLRALASSVRGE